MSMRHLRFLRYVDEVARAGSIRKAAEQLHVTASAVNRRVMDLEDEFEGSMSDEAVGTIQTVGQLIDYVRTNFKAPREKDKAGP